MPGFYIWKMSFSIKELPLQIQTPPHTFYDPVTFD